MYLPIPRSAATFVNADVNVVLPWSTCPIVPTFTCGFLRSYFAFAISILHPPASSLISTAQPSSPLHPQFHATARLCHGPHRHQSLTCATILKLCRGEDGRSQLAIRLTMRSAACIRFLPSLHPPAR